MSLFSAGKRIIEKKPEFLNVASQMYNILMQNSKKVRGKNNIIRKQGSFLRNCKIEIHGDNNIVEFSPKCYLTDTTIEIYGNNNKVVLGNQVCIHSGQLYIEDNGGEISIDDNTLICGKTHLAVIEGTKIIIGKDCLFSSNIDFRTGDSHSIIDENGRRLNKSKSIIIGNHVWICSQATLLKGGGVADNCIVGAAAVLTRRFTETNSIITGNPARVVKQGINWTRERIPDELSTY